MSKSNPHGDVQKIGDLLRLVVVYHLKMGVECHT